MVFLEKEMTREYLWSVCRFFFLVIILKMWLQPLTNQSMGSVEVVEKCGVEERGSF